MARARYVVQVLPDDSHASPKVEGQRAVSNVPPQQTKTPEPPVTLTSRIWQKPVASSVQELKDPFEEAGRIQRLFQETQMEEAREQPVIQRPRQPKRLQMPGASAQNTQESFFRSRLQEQGKTDRIEQFYRKAQKPVSTEPEKPVKKVKKTRSFRRWKIVVVASGIVLVCIVGLGAGGVTLVQANIHRTERDVQELMSDVRGGKWQSARERVDRLKARRSTSEKVYSFVRPGVRLALGKQKTTHIDQLFGISESGLQVLETGLAAQDSLNTAVQQFTGKQDGESLKTFADLTGKSEALYTELSALQAQADQLQNPFHLSVIDTLKKQLDEEVPQTRKYFAAVQKVGAVLPEILGSDGRRQYLVLLQNNMELRPTGGFIGSYGILTVEKGRFLDFQVEDVYEADGQLNGFVTPPPEIVQYLGEAKWYLRDVNWNPDFPVTAQQALWFLEKSTNVKADGVIAINLDVAQKLLKALGPVELVDYQEVITQDNLYVRAQTHSEMNFFPGSTQKKDFLSALANQLFYQMMKEGAPKLALAQAFYDAAEQSQLLIALNTPQAAQVLSGLGWDGSVRQPPCPAPFHTQTCFVDTVMQVEANVGVNKANQYVTRTIDHDVVLEGGRAKHTRNIVLENTAKSNAWPEGVYRSYIRLLVPKDAAVQSVSIDGQTIDSTSLRDVIDGERRSIGVYTEVPIQSKKTVQISYDVPLPQSAPLVYALFEQKQSGVSGDTLRHTVQTIDRPIITVAPSPKSAEGREVIFESQRLTHDFFAVEIQ